MRRLLLAALLGMACNTLPVGYDGLQRTPDVRVLEFQPETLVGYAKHVPLGSSSQLVLGRDAEYVSRVLLHFTISDSAIDSITGVQLTLHPLDSVPMFFTCWPCSTPWSEYSVTWRMPDSESQWQTPGGDRWPLELTRDTLLNDSLVLSLDLRYLDTLAHRSYGVLLLPRDTGFARINTGASTKTAPRLKIVYSDGGSRTRDITTEAHISDTLSVRFGPHDALVGSTVAFRTYARFGCDSLPTEATIVRAELRFRPRVLYRRQDTLGIGVHRLTAPPGPNIRNALFRSAADARTILLVSDTTDSLVRLDMRDLVQFWTAHPDSNFGLLLMSEPEYSLPWRIRIPRSGADAPRLIVQYAMPPSDRFFR